jgi:amino acid transporter
VYLEFVYRRPRFLASILIAVRSVILGFTASNAIVFGEYVLYALNRKPAQYEGQILGLALLSVIIVIHSCFLRTGIFIQNVLGWVKIALAVFMVFTSLFVVFFRSNKGTETTTTLQGQSISSIWDGSVWNWGIITTAMFKVSYSYGGLDNANNVLNEVRNPVKTLKSAATAALITSCLLYLLVNIAYFLVVPLEDIKQSGELIAALFFERVFGAEVGKVLLPLAIAVSAAGNVMVVTFSHVSLFLDLQCRTS